MFLGIWLVPMSFYLLKIGLSIWEISICSYLPKIGLGIRFVLMCSDLPKLDCFDMLLSTKDGPWYLVGMDVLLSTNDES